MASLPLVLRSLVVEFTNFVLSEMEEISGVLDIFEHVRVLAYADDLKL
jgi:hypothetical protein